jgi:uncharacterized protein
LYNQTSYLVSYRVTEDWLGQKKIIKVLAIDGGGIRGVIPATFCKHLETITGSTLPMWQLFDFIVGTSTGGIMTMLLTRPDPDHPGQAKFSAEDCVNLYVQDGKDLFSAPADYTAKNANNELPQFPDSSVTTTLQAYLPKPGCELKQALTEVAVTAYDLNGRSPVLFTSFMANKSPMENFYMRDVAQATSAFPGLFAAAAITSVGGEQSLLCVDGGMSGSSPTLQAYMWASQVTRAPESITTTVEKALQNLYVPGVGFPYQRVTLPLLFANPDPDLQVIVVSLGTGHYMAPVPYDTTSGWGFAQWMNVLPDVMFDATTRTADDEAQTFLGLDNYYRFQVGLPAELSGTATASDVETLRDTADKAMCPGGELYPEFQRLQKVLAGLPKPAAAFAA